jgi:predicted secreted protein
VSLTSGIAIFFVVWWIVLFAVLPWGYRTQGEEGAVVPGTEPSAPARFAMLRVALVTTVVAAVVFAGIYALLTSGLTFDDIPYVRDL